LAQKKNQEGKRGRWSILRQRTRRRPAEKEKRTGKPRRAFKKNERVYEVKKRPRETRGEKGTPQFQGNKCNQPRETLKRRVKEKAKKGKYPVKKGVCFPPARPSPAMGQNRKRSRGI